MINITICRRMPLETADIQLGDRLSVSLKWFGDFTATAHMVTNRGALFIFDQYVDERPMNEGGTNEGGYEASDLKEWVDTVLLKAFPARLRARIEELSIPTVGEFFGGETVKEAWGSGLQLPLMRYRGNRIACFRNELVWGWLRDAMQPEYSRECFATVNFIGNSSYERASIPYGVRPEFWLVR